MKTLNLNFYLFFIKNVAFVANRNKQAEIQKLGKLKLKYNFKKYYITTI